MLSGDYYLHLNYASHNNFELRCESRYLDRMELLDNIVFHTNAAVNINDSGTR